MVDKRRTPEQIAIKLEYDRQWRKSHKRIKSEAEKERDRLRRQKATHRYRVSQSIEVEGVVRPARVRACHCPCYFEADCARSRVGSPLLLCEAMLVDEI